MPAPTITGLAARMDAVEADIEVIFDGLRDLAVCVSLILRAEIKKEPQPVPDDYSPLDIAQGFMDQALDTLDVEDPLAT